MKAGRWPVWSVLIAGWVAVGLARAETEPRVYLDIPYVAAEAADPLQRLDLRVPRGEGPFPVVIMVHGGGWSSGDKSGAEKPKSGADITPWFAPLEEAGFLAVSINYRLAPANRWPACLEDTRAAVEWVRTHVAEYGGDPARMALIGHSAGGHLALLAAMPEDGKAPPVAAVVGCAAVSDLVSDTVRRGGPSLSMQNLFSITAETKVDDPEMVRRLADASPVSLVQAAYPPTLLLHGDADKTVPIGQSIAYKARLEELGVSCDLTVLAGAGHRLTEWSDHKADWAVVLTDWLNSKLGRAKELENTTAPR